MLDNQCFTARIRPISICIKPIRVRPALVQPILKGNPLLNQNYETIFRCHTVNGYRPIWSRDSSVGIATGDGLDDRVVGVRVPVESRIFSSPRRPERLLSNGYRGSFLGGRAVGA
jgi:hypothetical protein